MTTVQWMAVDLELHFIDTLNLPPPRDGGVLKEPSRVRNGTSDSTSTGKVLVIVVILRSPMWLHYVQYSTAPTVIQSLRVSAAETPFDEANKVLLPLGPLSKRARCFYIYTTRRCCPVTFCKRTAAKGNEELWGWGAHHSHDDHRRSWIGKTSWCDQQRENRRNQCHVFCSADTGWLWLCLGLCCLAAWLYGTVCLLWLAGERISICGIPSISCASIPNWRYCRIPVTLDWH